MTYAQTPMDWALSTSSAADSPAKTSAWLDAVRAWLASGAACFFSSPGSSELSALLGALSKTSQDFSVQTMDEISQSSSPRWPNSGIGGPTGCLILSASESPSVAAVSTLSDILEVRAHPKYSLSPRACAGILRRAKRRRRKLPEPLDAALRSVGGMTATQSPSSLTHCSDKATTDKTRPAKPTSSTLGRRPSSGPSPLTPVPTPLPLFPELSPEPKRTTEIPRPSRPTTSSKPHIRGATASASGAIVRTPLTSGTPRPSPNPSEPTAGEVATPTATREMSWSVRRLTPTECERLQGFPDNWTLKLRTDPDTVHLETP